MIQIFMIVFYFQLTFLRNMHTKLKKKLHQKKSLKILIPVCLKTNIYFKVRVREKERQGSHQWIFEYVTVLTPPWTFCHAFVQCLVSQLFVFFWYTTYLCIYHFKVVIKIILITKLASPSDFSWVNGIFQ